MVNGQVEHGIAVVFLGQNDALSVRGLSVHAHDQTSVEYAIGACGKHETGRKQSKGIPWGPADHEIAATALKLTILRNNGPRLRRSTCPKRFSICLLQKQLPTDLWVIMLHWRHATGLSGGFRRFIGPAARLR